MSGEKSKEKLALNYTKLTQGVHQDGTEWQYRLQRSARKYYIFS